MCVCECVWTSHLLPLQHLEEVANPGSQIIIVGRVAPSNINSPGYALGVIARRVQPSVPFAHRFSSNECCSLI